MIRMIILNTMRNIFPQTNQSSTIFPIIIMAQNPLSKRSKTPKPMIVFKIYILFKNFKHLITNYLNRIFKIKFKKIIRQRVFFLVFDLFSGQVIISFSNLNFSNMRSFYKYFLASLLSAFGLSLSAQYLFSIIFIWFSLNIKAQHNYDSQSVIYSNGGKVGIGTTTPTAKLHVNGDIKVSENIIIGKHGNVAIIEGFNSINKGMNSVAGSDLVLRAGLATGNSSDGSLIFQVGNNANDGNKLAGHPIEAMRIIPSADPIDSWTRQAFVGIGTTTPTAKLHVNGDIKANGLKVYGEVSAKKFRTSSTGADFVFQADYKLRPLEDVAQFVQKHKHLPDIAPAKTMQAEGIDLGEMNTKLLQKVEELTLYLIEQNKKLKRLEEEVKSLKQR